MQFKTAIITGVLYFLMCSLSIATPISQKEISPQKTEQANKSKPNFIQKIILKKIQKKAVRKSKSGETASPLSKVSFWLGILAIPLFFLAAGTYIGIALEVLALLGAIGTGVTALSEKDKNRKTRFFAITGIVLGVVIAALFIAVLPIILYSISEANFFD